MPIITTKSGCKILKKAESLMLLPYVYDEELNDYVLGDTAYDLTAIIGDSIALEQSDGETQTKVCEFYASPVVENRSGGTIGFSAQCLDLQNSVMRALFGAMTATDSVNHVSKDIAALMDDYVTLFALIRIRFKDEDTPDVYLPKVLLNSKLMLEQLKTRGSQGNLAGSVLSCICAVMSVDVPTKLVKFTLADGEETYIPLTPVLFMPRECKPVFFHHINDTTDGDEYVFTQIDWTVQSGSCVANNVVVTDVENGDYEIVVQE